MTNIPDRILIRIKQTRPDVDAAAASLALANLVQAISKLHIALGGTGLEIETSRTDEGIVLKERE